MAKATLADKVLVVDDDPSFHRFIESVLGPTGLNCVCVRSGEKALSMAEESRPKALILDGLLPGVRGDEVALRLRRFYPKEVMPIIFVSAFFRDLKSRLHLTGKCQVDMVLHKPLSADELREAIGRIPSLAPLALPALPRPQEQEFDLDLELDVDMSAAVELLADYLARAQERVKAMRDALVSLGGENQGPALEVLKAEAHRFHGSGATFGLPELTRLGGQLEGLLGSVAPGRLPATTRARLTGLLDALAQKVARSEAQAPVPVASEERPLRLVLLDGPGELAVACAETGGVVTVCSEVKDVLAVITEQPPDAVFIAGDRMDFDALGAVGALSAAGVRPLVFMSRRAALPERLEALRRGAQGYTHPLPDPSALLRAARQLLGSRAGFSVVALDSDPAALEELAKALAPHHLTVAPCTRPEELFSTLRQSAPSLVVLRADQGGIELLRALKSDINFRPLPILIIADEVSFRVEAFKAGADAVALRPFEAEEIALRARALVERWASQQQATGIDPLTGAFSEAYLRRACERALKLARRGRPLALLLFEASTSGLVAEPDSLALEEALAALGGRLRRSFRETDVVARLSEGRFAVLLHDVSKEDSSRLLELCLSTLAGSPMSSGLSTRVRGGFATFPEVAGGFEALVAAAKAQLS